nr:histone-lysine N-methyltransferase, H3 lysine-79 specific isoform X2 [Drosophila bipectinata]
MATPQVKDLVLRSPAGSSDVITFAWPLQIGHGQDKHDNGIDIIDTIKFVCDELPSMSSAFEETNLNQIDTACYKTMTGLVDRFNKAVDSIVALEKGTSLPAERLNKFAHPSLLRHILQLVYNAAVLDPDKLNQYEPFSPEVYGETSYELVQQMLKHVTVSKEDTFIDLGSGVGQVVLQMAGSFPLKTCIGIEKADTPARYAERMDVFFRQYMGWFGKRYCEYKLIKGDFLVDEHREKITSSTLVFVNNFAFGPTVDHQLKERFADLRDGARVVSSKSFCPLNFRITDRNLSDIGTIMHVSEIPPLKGSVSWTCKPVSYYLHVIDRTILERYFQRLKTKGGNDHEGVGTVRTTRDRAKREANVGQHHNHHHNHHNNSSNHATSNNNHHREREQSNGAASAAQVPRQKSQSPANVSGGGLATVGGQPGTGVGAGASAAANSKTRQQLQQQQQQQRSLDMESSTESDGEATNGNGGNTTTTTNATSASNGPMTRKVWSDWCSSKGKSSQSDDEENNNSNSNGGSNTGTGTGGGAGGAVGRQARAATQKKRKKLTRKAAIASKSAAAAQREAEAAAAAVAAATASKDSSSKEDQPRAAIGGPGRKGRMKKGARGRKSLKIAGLEALHKQTVLSTSLDAMTKKLPAAPGTVDQQLTALLTDSMAHTELDIPTAPQDTPYALQILLDVFRSQYMAIIDHMKSSAFVPQVQKQLAQEQERMARLKNRASQLDKQIKVLIDDSVALLKVRMNELGINVNSPNDLIAQAKEIVGRHKDLQHTVSRMRNEVTYYEGEQKHLLSKQLKNLPEYQKLCTGANGKVKLEMPPELSETTAQELVLKEIANTLSQRKKLYAQVSNIEQETTVLQKSAEERSTAAVLLAQGTNMSLASGSPATASAASSTPATAHAGATPVPVPNNKLNSAKNSRRSREHRGRSQEWPEVPEVGKIQESNPEVLAQKIVETCRQIEAGKFQGAATPAYQVNGKNKAIPEAGAPQAPIAVAPVSIKSSPGHHYKDSTLMPAPKQQSQQQVAPSLLPKCELGGLSASRIKQESPKVANFEDRLKSIITTALNEDQEHRSKAVEPSPSPSPLHSPAPKRSKQQQQHAGSMNPGQQQLPNNLHNIITVSTQGLMHLNANTTISPITPPLPGPGAGAAASTAPPPPANLPYGAYGGKATVSGKYQAAKEPKYSPVRQAPPPPPPPPSHMAALYAAGQQTGTADLSYQRRRSSVSASSYEHFMAQQQQQQQQHALMLAAAAHAAQRQHMRAEEQQQSQAQQHHQHQQHRLQQQQHLQHHHHPNEFKAPPAENLLQRSGSREQLIVEPQQQPLELLPRASSANSDYGGYRIRPPSRPSSNSSQPDYTQVSPAKMALRRHLSQEKLSQHATPQATPPLPGAGAPTSGKTIGDLVNGEIERTLEISHQSIINAAVNMSTGGAHFMERAFLNERSNERMLINLNAQRPERVHVRPLSEESQEPHPTSYAQERSSAGSAAANSNLATLAHVAYVQKAQGAARAGATAPPAAQHHTATARTGRDYQPVALPRAELKGSIEAYFHEEQQQQQQQKQSKGPGSGSSGAAAMRGSRLNGANPPLEGLAASLQDHVRARKYKEETEERQRRAAAAASSSSSSSSSGVSNSALELSNHYGHQAPPAHNYHHHHHGANLNGTPHKVELGVKRSSPLAPHQQPPRPSKLAHYDAPPTSGQAHHAHIYANGQVLQPPPAHDATTPSPTPSSSSSSCGRRSGSNSGKLLVEPPLLMSPEINSLMGDERPLQLSSHPTQSQMLHQQHQPAHLQQLRVPHLGHGHGNSHSTTPTLGERRNANAADDVNDLATQRTITNYDPRRRLRTTLSGGSPAKLSAAHAHAHASSHSSQTLNGYVLADSSSSCPTIPNTQ